MPHDFKKFPELTNAQMETEYFNSPHKQIVNDFRAKVVGVHDGDTIKLNWADRDFYFPIRFTNIAAPELKEEGGPASQKWLESLLLGKEVDIQINMERRVDKWGRLLGNVMLDGMDVGEQSIVQGKSKPWSQRTEGKISLIETMVKLPKEMKW